MKLYQVTAPNFTAGFTVEGGVVTEAAPILVRWVKPWRLSDVEAISTCRKRGWKVERVDTGTVREDSTGKHEHRGASVQGGQAAVPELRDGKGTGKVADTRGGKPRRLTGGRSARSTTPPGAGTPT
jgi:hypothetical protein